MVLGLLLLSSVAWANNALEAEQQEPVYTNQGGVEARTPEKGWFWQYWFQMQQEEKERIRAELAAQKEREQAQPEEEEEKDPCVEADTWTASCGFIDPGLDYDFSQEQRKELLQAAVMAPNDANKVKELQRFNSWAVSKAVTMMKMWQWNMVQDQELNPNITAPIATFALQAMSDVRSRERVDVVRQIREGGGFLMYFTRKECEACAIQAPAIRGLSRWIDLPVYEANLSGGCHNGFEGEYCQEGEHIIEAARHLNVAMVPDLWLYLKEQDMWMRVSSGLEAQDTIAERIKLFFQGVVGAVAKGMSQAEGQPAPVDFDFSQEELMGGAISTTNELINKSAND